MNTKPTVTFIPESLSLNYFYGKLCAYLIPVDHPATDRVKNGEGANTSEIVAFDIDAGTFETKNTLYVPAA